MEKITLKCNKNILNLLKQYNIYTKTYIENPRRFQEYNHDDDRSFYLSVFYHFGNFALGD